MGRLRQFVIGMCAIASTACLTTVGAQERKAPPEIKMLSPEECALISKRSENDYYVKGPVTIGGITIEKSNLTRKGVIFNGDDHFEVIQRSCFGGKRT
jgi:hypothetical protein